MKPKLFHIAILPLEETHMAIWSAEHRALMLTASLDYDSATSFIPRINNRYTDIYLIDFREDPLMAWTKNNSLYKNYYEQVAEWLNYLQSLEVDYRVTIFNREVSQIGATPFKEITGYSRRTNEQERIAAMHIVNKPVYFTDKKNMHVPSAYDEWKHMDLSGAFYENIRTAGNKRYSQFIESIEKAASELGLNKIHVE